MGGVRRDGISQSWLNKKAALKKTKKRLSTTDKKSKLKKEGNMQQKKLIYAVDDEQSIREVYGFALDGAGFETKCFCGAADLYAAVKERVPDLFILDIMLDGEDGYSILSRLKSDAKTADVPVIMVSAKTTEIDKVKGLNLGADDYLSKPFGVLELAARINAKLRATKNERDKLSFKDVCIDDDKHVVTVGEKPVRLTLKQYELLKVLVLNAEKAMRRDDLLDAVWGLNYGETRTLDIHVADLRKILDSSAAEIETVRGLGYILK